MKQVHIHAIVLAAGRSSRFGCNKLRTRLEEKSILEYTLEKLYNLELAQISIVVNAYTKNIPIKQKDVRLIENIHPEYGISHSIHLALQAGDTYDAYLFVVGDQPLLRQQTLQVLLQTYQAMPGAIVGIGKNGLLGNPVIFPKCYKEGLLTLKGDQGGKALIHREELSYVIVEALEQEELWDIDTVEDFEKIKRRIHNGITKT